MSLFSDPGSEAVRAFVQEMVNVGDETGSAILAQDVITAAQSFLAAFLEEVAQAKDRLS
ncbi:MAG: hypothetical protein ABI065_08510 [Terrimesophilobacter sp.]